MKLVQNLKHLARDLKDTAVRGWRNRKAKLNPTTVEWKRTPGAFGAGGGRFKDPAMMAKRIRRNRKAAKAAKRARKLNYRRAKV
jgi:hypothetical protein